VTRRAALVLLALAGCAEVGATEETWVAVSRDDLVLEVDVTGALRATLSSPVGPPTVPDMWDFKIVRLANEGTEVKKGQPVIWFDASELERQLAERTSERDQAAQEIVKKRIDLDLARGEGQMRLAEAEGAFRKAQIRADLPAKYTAAVEMKLARIDLESARAELEAAQRRLEYQLKLGEAELAYLRDRQARAHDRVQRLEAAIKVLAVTSPLDGLVVHRSNWRGDKKKVGETCWAGDECIEVVDVSRMIGKGEVDETESARVRVGQTARLRLESLPELEWKATIAALRPTIYRQSPRTPLKVIGLDLELEKTDRARMRPGMQFRGRIETGRAPKAVLVPLEAVFSRPQGPVAFRRTAVGHEAVRLQLGKRNLRYAEVLSGLAPGDKVARRDLEEVAP
jgi:multidrug efflux pump subunit AcrA (membrane-fusion protein)